MVLRRLFGEIYNGRGSSAAALQSILTKFAVLTLNAATSLVVARTLGPIGRGEMSALLVWCGFLSGLFSCGLPAALIFNLRITPGARSKIVGAAFVLTLTLCVVVGLTGIFALPLFLTNYSPRDISLARWFLLTCPVPLFLSTGRAAMEASGRFSSSNFSLWFGPFITLLALVILALSGRLTPLTAGLAYQLGYLPSWLWLGVAVWQEYKPGFDNLLSTCRDLLHYGLRSWGIDLLNALATNADQVLIVRFLSPSAMGVYIVAVSLARFIGIFQASAVMVLFPRVAAQSRREVISLTGLTTRISSLSAIVTATVLGIAGPFLLGLLYGKAYIHDGTTVFRICLCETVLAGATQVLAQAFMASGRPGTVTIIQAVGIGIGICSMPNLILKFGVAGAAIALLIATIIRLTLTLICFPAILEVAIPSLIPRRSDLIFVVARVRGFLTSDLATV